MEIYLKGGIILNDNFDGQDNGRKISDAKLRKSLFCIFAVIALSFFASAAMTVYRYYTAANYYTSQTDGVVTGVKVKKQRSKVRRHSHISYSYYPKFEFIVDGVLIQKTGKLPYAEEFCTEGRPVTVLYDPKNPKRCCLEGDIAGYESGLAFYVLSYGAVGVFILFSGWRLSFGKKKRIE